MLQLSMNHISGVMVSVLVWSAVDAEFEPRSGQTKDYTIGICCFSAKDAAKTGWLGIMKMCQSCFCELAL